LCSATHIAHRTPLASAISLKPGWELRYRSSPGTSTKLTTLSPAIIRPAGKHHDLAGWDHAAASRLAPVPICCCSIPPRSASRGRGGSATCLMTQLRIRAPSPFLLRLAVASRERLPPLSGRHLAARTRRPAGAGRSGHFECRPGSRASGRDCAQHGLVRLGSSSLYLCRSGTHIGVIRRDVARIALLTRSGTLAWQVRTYRRLRAQCVLVAHEKGFRQAA